MRRRDSKVDKEKSVAKDKEKPETKKDNEEDCITISDDEEVREPSNFTAAAGMGANELIKILIGLSVVCSVRMKPATSWTPRFKGILEDI
ncbi:unnamed protein product [Danaus chrysippus]|uniref:(African queen) hypothetical protein n=1 Tax=Danaus chrysippus TaxID=151541 RepID=A0A8J2W819_9NEOP|nr:unnamed protein product [Danaus chrysippus]